MPHPIRTPKDYNISGLKCRVTNGKLKQAHLFFHLIIRKILPGGWGGGGVGEGDRKVAYNIEMKSALAMASLYGGLLEKVE